MKEIRVDFIDFWPGFDKQNNDIYHQLKQKYNVKITDKPDYVFCSLFGSKHLQYTNQVKILLIGENIAPDFNVYDYAIGFYDMQYKDRYLQYNILFDEEMIKLTQHRCHNTIPKKFCAFVYSKNKLDKKRKEIFDVISTYKKVDAGGKYLNNIGRKIGREKQDKINFQKQYKFVIACENQSYPEYNTEKLLEAFASGGIPIYWGDPNIHKIYNKEAFINCMEYKSLEEVKEKIKKLDNNDKAYLQMIQQPVFHAEFNFEKEREKLAEFLEHIIEQENPKRVSLTKEYYAYERYSPYFPVAKLLDIYVALKSIIKKCLQKIRS